MTAESFVSRAAGDAGVEALVVADVLARHHIATAIVRARPRSIRVDSLRMTGARTGTSPSPIDRTFTFSEQVSLIVGPNLRGKSTVLELITLCLRGTRRDLQADVASWIQEVTLKTTINGTATTFLLTMTDGNIARGQVVEEASGAPITLVDASTEDEYASSVQALMLARLDLDTLHAMTADGAQVHAWPTYFSCLYPASGGDRLLIGPAATGGLTARLINVFLDLPGAALLTQVATAAKLSVQQDAAQQGARQADSDRFHQQRQALAAQAERVRADILALEQGPQPARSVSVVATELATVGLQLAAVSGQRAEAQATLGLAVRSAVSDERALNDFLEGRTAARLFHGLDPSTCPRCESTIGAERRDAERDDHACAVCTTPLLGTDGDDEEQTREELRAQLAASQEAQAAVSDAVATLTDQMEALRSDAARLEAELAEAQTAQNAQQLHALQLEQASVTGALEALPETPQSPSDSDNVDARVLKAVEALLRADLNAASNDLRSELGMEIANFARRFGMAEITNATLNGAGHLKVEKAGIAAGSFSAQTPGERLRLRIATVLALLTVADRHGHASHPGLLLLDSLRSEEIQAADADTLLRAIVAVAADVPGLQVIATTADESLGNGVLPEGAVFTPNADGYLF